VNIKNFKWFLIFLLIEFPFLTHAEDVRIGNSSVWVSSAQYDNLVKTGTLLAPMLDVALRGQITNIDVNVLIKLLAPYLSTDYFLKNPKPSWYKEDPSDIGYMIVIDSTGGDVYAAMAIGRIFRKARVSVLISNKCMSSCVFLLAGAVKRWIPDGIPVGIHRPYMADTAKTSFEELQAKTTRLGVDVAAYLDAMNIPKALFEHMKSIPSESIKVLSDAELMAYGLSVDDPVFVELNDNASAKLANVSKGEYLKRKALTRQCKLPGFLDLKSTLGREPDIFEVKKMSDSCEQHIIYKDVMDENGNWKSDPLDDYCSKLIVDATDALGLNNWSRVLEVAQEREGKCSEKMSKMELAEVVSDQASALLALKRFRDVVVTSDRCIKIDNISSCHIVKGDALLDMSLRSDAVKEIIFGRRLAEQEIARLNVDIKKSSSERETRRLRSQLSLIKSHIDYANALLRSVAN